MKKMTFLNDNYMKVVFTFIILICITSCIPTKRVAYLDNENSESGNYNTPSWSYKVQKGDRFFITIENAETSLSIVKKNISNSGTNRQQGNIIRQEPTINDYVVNLEGNVNLPVIGDVKLEGTELSEVASLLKEKCTGYITSPSIKVFMMNYNVTILGEVQRPGFYQLVTTPPTIFDAIGLAGDLTDFAERREVQIQRRNENGSVQVEYINLLDPSTISSPYYFIQPNDVIHVRPLKVKKITGDSGLPLILSAITTFLTIYTIIRTN